MNKLQYISYNNLILYFLIKFLTSHLLWEIKFFSLIFFIKVILILYENASQMTKEARSIVDLSLKVQQNKRLPNGSKSCSKQHIYELMTVFKLRA